MYPTNASLVFVLLLSLFSFAAHGQDPVFTQYYLNRLFVNPAFAGVEQGLTLSAVSRTQWSKVDRGFRTQAFSLEKQEPRISMGFGLNAYRSEEGNAGYVRYGVGVSFSRILVLSGGRSNLHLGGSVRYGREQVDWSRLVFSDQLDPVFGLQRPPSMLPVNESVSYWDADAGILYRFEGRGRSGRRTISKTRGIAGLSVNHLFGLFGSRVGSDNSFQALDSTRLAPRLTLHGSLEIPLIYLQGVDNSIAIMPTLKVDVQGKNPLAFKKSMMASTWGAYFLYRGAYAGAFYQHRTPFPGSGSHTNTLTFALGAYLPTRRTGGQVNQKLLVGFSFDYNVTGVGTAAGSVYELALRYNFGAARGWIGQGRGRGGPDRIMDCKNFF